MCGIKRETYIPNVGENCTMSSSTVAITTTGICMIITVWGQYLLENEKEAQVIKNTCTITCDVYVHVREG